MKTYDTWLSDPTPENMGAVLKELDPVITSEIHRYPGPKTLLRGKSKTLAIKAIKSYDPARNAALSSWVVSQLKPLSRYSNSLKAVGIPERNAQQAAEINQITQRLNHELDRQPTDEEIADEIGIPIKRLNYIRGQSKPIMSESALTTQNEDNEDKAVDLPIYNTNTMDVSANLLLASLGDREKFIFEAKTGFNGKPVLSNIEIARRLGITPAMVTQISNNIKNRLVEVNKNAI